MSFGILMVLMFDGSSKIDAQLGKEQSLLSDLFKAFERPIFLHAYAICYELPSNKSTIICTLHDYEKVKLKI